MHCCVYVSRALPHICWRPEPRHWDTPAERGVCAIRTDLVCTHSVTNCHHL